MTIASENGRFLLYIDILGFSEMSRTDPAKIERVYSIVDSLNAHRHQSFKTIVFSDTILVYNPDLAGTDEQKDYLVWYLIEFAEDLHHRLTGQNVFFRAVLIAGDFSHYKLQNIECFYGSALVNAYLREKTIPSIGLFIDPACNAHNRYFRVQRFDNDLYFVYLNRSLETLNEHSAQTFPCSDPETATQTPYAPWQVLFLKDVNALMRTHPDPVVRTKFLTAWDLYRQRYGVMLHVLERSGFALSALAPNDCWKEEEAEMNRQIAELINPKRPA